MVKGIKITLFLADGRPDGLRILDQGNWSGRALDFARADWSSVRDEPELRKPGVYVLRGEQDDGTTAIYVGEADELRSRLAQHQARIDNWSRATAFVTKDDSLNKATVKYLESRLIALGHAAKRASMLNGNVPGLPAMSRADISEAEGYLEHMLPIMPLLGIVAFQAAAEAKADASGTVLVLNRSGIAARARETGEGFLVEAGATARSIEQPSIHPYMRAIRARLVRDGLFVLEGNHYRLTEDQLFGSPSTAAGVLLGRAASGPMEWKDDSGRRLKELRERVASEEDALGTPGPIARGGDARPLKLHEAMAVVLRDHNNEPRTPRQLAAEINERGLYRQRDGGTVPSGQISARLAHYQDIFERSLQGIRLRDPGRHAGRDRGGSN